MLRSLLIWMIDYAVTYLWQQSGTEEERGPESPESLAIGNERTSVP